MSKAFSCGAEIEVGGHLSSSPEPFTIVGTVTRDTTVFRSGVASWKCDSGGGSAAASIGGFGFVTTNFTGTSYFRAYMRFASLPSFTVRIMRLLSDFTVRLTSTGKLQLFNETTGTQIGSDSVETITTNNFEERIELSITLSSSTVVTGAELRLNGVSVASVTGLSLTPTLGDFVVGWIDAPGANIVCNIDDVSENTDSGAVNNSWCGPGKVILMMPKSDAQIGSWTGGVGGTTNLWDAVNNTPPIGTATETDLTQIESIDSTGGGSAKEYRGDCGTYAAAGIGPNDVINYIAAYACDGEDVSTGTKVGVFGIQANPAGTYVSFNYGHDAGTLGTWPTNWFMDSTVQVDNPTINKNQSLILAIDKTDAGTRVASCCFLGAYVEYVPVTVTAAPPPSIQPLLTTLARKLSRFRLLVPEQPTIPAVVGANYVDSATISSVTSLTSTETTDYVESATIASVTSVSAVETYLPFTPFIQEPSIQPLLVTLTKRLDNLKLLTGRPTPYLGPYLSELHETFDSIAIWTRFDDGSTLSSSINGQLLQALSAAGVYARIITDFSYATPSAAYVQVVDPGIADATLVRYFLLTNNQNIANPSDFIGFKLDGTTLTLTATDLINFTTHNLGTVAWNATTTPWLRIRIESDFVYWEYAASSSGPWTVLASNAASNYPWRDSAFVGFVSGGATASAANVIWDNVNVQAAIYVDSATIPSVTSVSATEIAQYVDSATIASTTSLTYTESADYVDAATIAGTTSVISAELFVQFIQEPSHHPILVTLSRVDGLRLPVPSPVASPSVGINYVDSATISSVTSVQSSENTDFLDTSGTIQGTSSVTTTETSQFVESATLSTVTSLTYTEAADYVDSATLTSITYVIVVMEALSIAPPSLRPLLMSLGERFHLLHNNILTPDQQAAAGYVDSATIAGVTSVQSSENTDFLDTSGTVQGTSSVTSAEIAQYVDAQTVAGTTTPSSVEVAAYVEANTVAGTTSLTYTESADYVDSATTPSVTSVSYVETADYVDSATIASVTSVSAVETYGQVTTPPHPLLIAFNRMRPRLLQNLILNPADSVRVNYVDSATISGVTSVQSSENTDFLDTSGTIQGTSSITSTELAAYVDSQTISGTTTPSSTDIAAFVEANTVAGVTSVSAVETAAYVDAATVASVTSLTYTEIANYVDAATIASITTLTSVDIQAAPSPTQIPLLIRLASVYGYFRLLHGDLLSLAVAPTFNYVDSATIASTTSVSSTDIADVVESVSISGVTSVQSSESTNFIDTGGTIQGTSSIISTEIAQYVDASTIAGTSSVTSAELAAFVDAATVASVTSVTYTETADYVDSATLTSVTSLISFEQVTQLPPIQRPVLIKLGLGRGKLEFLNYTIPVVPLPPVNYVDSATISSSSSVTSSDIAADVESQTISSVTSISYTEGRTVTDSNTCSSATSVATVEFASYRESATIPSVTSLTSGEIYISAARLDSATITSITTVLSSEYGAFKIVDFVCQAYREYFVTATRHFGTASAWRRWFMKVGNVE